MFVLKSKYEKLREDFEELKEKFKEYREIHPTYDVYRWKNEKPKLAKERAEDYGVSSGFPPRRGVLLEIPTGNKIQWMDVDGDYSFNLNSNMDEIMLYWFKKWEQECNYKLFMPSEYGKSFCEILADGLVRGDLRTRYTAYNIGRTAGFLCVDDIREKENLNPLPDGLVGINLGAARHPRLNKDHLALVFGIILKKPVQRL